MRTSESQIERNPKFHDENIKKLAKTNRLLRQVIYNGPHSQPVEMSIPPGKEIGEEVQSNTDQVLVIVDGEAEAFLDGRRQPAREHNDIIFMTGLNISSIHSGLSK